MNARRVRTCSSPAVDLISLCVDGIIGGGNTTSRGEYGVLLDGYFSWW